jgi:uncharacterized protein (DUF1778 family)
MPQESIRTARLEARISPDALALVKRAAEIQGGSVSDFVVAAAREAAHRTIEETEIIRLSVEDQRLLAEALLDPPEPPPDLARRLPRYPTLPAVRIGRLAVDTRFRGQGFGRLLLWDATMRALRAEQANFTLLVDAKDAAALEFYRHHGFVSFATAPRVLFLPLATAAKILDRNEP